MSHFKKVTIVGPLAPPAGGMANQTKKLAEFLRSENITVDVIRTNPDYKPAFIGKLPVIRALFRLVSYKLTLMKHLKNTDIIHIMANSGWSWHLFAAPAIVFGRFYNKPVIVNYRGGYAADFFSKSWFWVNLTLKRAQSIVVPSIFLHEVFDDFGKPSIVIPNVLDRDLFFQDKSQKTDNVPHLIVTRNLEGIYDVATAVQAFNLVIKEYPQARLSIAGTGPEKQTLIKLIAELKLNNSVFFTGRLGAEEMAKLYQQADIMLNASTVDNTPNSIIEALACGTPVVSTNAGGIPKLVKHQHDALLVNIADHQTMAASAVEILKNPALQQILIDNGLQTIKKFYWSNVWLKLKACYDKSLVINRKNNRQINSKRSRNNMTGIYTTLVSTLLFPLHERLKKHETIAIKTQLEKSQWLPKNKIMQAQNERLQQFIGVTLENVPYYQALFNKLGLSSSDISSVADLHKLSFLDKNTIRENYAELRSNQAGVVSSFTTGGSSGTPLTFLLGNERVSHDVAEKWRATRWWGVDIGDKEIVAWGSPIELGAQDKVRILRDKLFRSTLIPAFDMGESKLLGFIDKIQHIQPAMLFGYPSVFSLIAKLALAKNIDLTQLGIKVVFVTSERLYPYQREIIEEAFGAPVANGYGSRDAGFIAHQCPSGSMHISAEDLIVEIVDNNGKVVADGEKGEIVVTHMATSDFPFIRYRTGDIAALDTKACACGRGLPVLKDIEGRTTDFVVAANGTIMHGLALIYILRELDGIEEFKIIQETKLHTVVQIVPNEHKTLSSELQNKIIAGFKARLGDEVMIELEIIKEIAAEKSGKFRYVISKVVS